MDKNSSHIGFAFKLYKAMLKDNLGYIYRGRFSQEITDNILSLTENNLEKTEQSSKIKKRVYSIMVECLQNITRHQDDAHQDSPDNYGIFVIQRKDERYFITTGNSVKDENIEPIKDLIEKINSLEKEELKQYYKEVLNTGAISLKGGAGLGLIDMARKSGNKLSYYFKEMKKNLSYFYLHTIPSLELDGEGQKEDLSNVVGDSLHNIIGIHEILNKENILLVYNGIFSQDSLMTLLSAIEGQMQGSPNLRKRLFHLVVEMLQNIVKHADNRDIEVNGNPGIFLISQMDGHYYITTGNYILNDKIDHLKGKIDEINSLDKEKLEYFYNNRLFNFDSKDENKGGLGLIDLRIKSGKELLSNFHKIDSGLSFFILQARAIIQ